MAHAGQPPRIPLLVHEALPPFSHPPHRKLSLLKALGPLTVCIISIALMNIFQW